MRLSITEAELSIERDQDQDPLHSLTPRKVLVVGATEPLGISLAEGLDASPHVLRTDHGTLDFDADLESQRDWCEYRLIVNAAGYSAVDTAETAEGRVAAWSENVHNVGRLARIARDHGIVFVQFSSDDVFDGTKSTPYTETDPVCPVSVFGQTRAAGEEAAMAAPKHYVLRTGWVIAEGPTFLSAMRTYAEGGMKPRVVNDQYGRLTFSRDLGRAIHHLMGSGADYGVYHVTSSGEPLTWEEIAKEVFGRMGRDPKLVQGCKTSEFHRHSAWPIAPRPKNAVLDLGKIEATGFVPSEQKERIREYLAGLEMPSGSAAESGDRAEKTRRLR